MSLQKKLLAGQSGILFIGTIVAWTGLLNQLQAFHAQYGTYFRFVDCTTPNPLLTPCFFGSVAFLIALFWSVLAFQDAAKNHVRALRWFLLACVIFAASVFSYETAEYYKLFNPGAFSVTCAPGVPPFKTTCFYGLVAYIGAFITAIFVMRAKRSVVTELLTK